MKISVGKQAILLGGGKSSGADESAYLDGVIFFLPVLY